MDSFAWRFAQEIVESLMRCRFEPTFSALRENVSAYARDVLRLPIVSDQPDKDRM